MSAPTRFSWANDRSVASSSRLDRPPASGVPVSAPALPEMLQVVDALPSTMTGKVQKFLLREAARTLAEGVTGAR